MKNIREILAANIVFARKSKGITQVDLAKAGKISTNTLQRAENPHVTGAIELETVASIASALHMSVAELLNEVPPGLEREHVELISLIGRLPVEQAGFLLGIVRPLVAKNNAGKG